MVRNSAAASTEKLTKFLLRVTPRVLLVPDFQSSVGALISMDLVKSPAPNILATSDKLLLTLHADAVLRLWNTNDGRCISNSYPDLFMTKPLAVMTLAEYPGFTLVVGD